MRSRETRMRTVRPAAHSAAHHTPDVHDDGVGRDVRSPLGSQGELPRLLGESHQQRDVEPGNDRRRLPVGDVLEREQENRNAERAGNTNAARQSPREAVRERLPRRAAGDDAGQLRPASRAEKRRNHQKTLRPVEEVQHADEIAGLHRSLPEFGREGRGARIVNRVEAVEHGHRFDRELDGYRVARDGFQESGEHEPERRGQRVDGRQAGVF